VESRLRFRADFRWWRLRSGQPPHYQRENKMTTFLLTAILFLILLVVGLLVYLLYAVRAIIDTQDVIFDAAVNAEEMYKEIEMNQEAIMNAHFKQN